MGKERKLSVFFAIPCGDFFSVQNQIIISVCEKADINPVIIEDRSDTSDLWKNITREINSADYFLADISSLSPNVILELGYTIREKNPKFYAIFIADNIKIPSDLGGFKLQKYSSLPDFQRKLVKWISDNIPFIDRKKLLSLETSSLNFYEEDFMSYERFLRLWTFPPQCSFCLTSEGLRFTNAHFPIMTTHLGLLQNYAFEFQGKIESRYLGWIVRGTKSPDGYLPTFCIMFQLSPKGILIPHIFNHHQVEPRTHYRVFKEKRCKAKLKASKEGWFTITTKVVGDKITIFNSGEIIFEDNFSLEPYKKYYEFPYKQGEVGFRCYPGEQGVIRYVKVKEI